MEKKEKALMQVYSKLLRRPETFYLDPTYNLERFAKDLNLNRTYASQFSNDVLGKPFRLLIAQLRVKYATELMKSGDMPLTAIAKASGFSSDISFRRAFVKEYGVNPSQNKAKTE